MEQQNFLVDLLGLVVGHYGGNVPVEIANIALKSVVLQRLHYERLVHRYDCNHTCACLSLKHVQSCGTDHLR